MYILISKSFWEKIVWNIDIRWSFCIKHSYMSMSIENYSLSHSGTEEVYVNRGIWLLHPKKMIEMFNLLTQRYIKKLNNTIFSDFFYCNMFQSIFLKKFATKSCYGRPPQGELSSIHIIINSLLITVIICYHLTGWLGASAHNHNISAARDRSFPFLYIVQKCDHFTTGS